MARFSTVSALLALFFTSIYFLPTNFNTIKFQIGSASFSIQPFQFFPFFIAGIILLGSYWIMEVHPNLNHNGAIHRQVLPNLVLPTMSVLIYSYILVQTEKGLAWWGLLGLGVFIYMLVFYSEFQVFKPDVSSETIFTVLLIGLAHALFMVLAIALRASISRIFVLIPALSFAATFVIYRTLFLRSEGNVQIYWLIFDIFIISQFSIALYYLFITPNQYGFILTAILFSCNAFIVRTGQGDRKKLFIEPLAMILFVVLWIIFSKLL